MRVLVTGARGFLGRHILHSLSRRSEFEVVADRRLEDRPAIDLLDRAAAQHLVTEMCPSHVVHACGSHPKRAMEDLFLVHSVTTQNLLDAFAQAGQIVRWINIGTAASYGAQDPEIEPHLEESHPDQVLSEYAGSKVAQEQAVAAAAECGVVRPTFLRVFNAIGPGQSGPFLVPAILEQLRGSCRSVLRLGNLDCVRDFVDVRDVAEAVVTCLRFPRTNGEKLNVCSGVGTRVDEIAYMLMAAVTRKRDLRLDAVPLPPPAIRYQRGSYRRIEELCGWRPRYTLAETVRDIWQEAVGS